MLSQGVLDRFKQIQPKVIFSVDAVVYNGRSHDHMTKLRQVVDGLPELERVVILPYVRSKEELDISDIPNRSVPRGSTSFQLAGITRMPSSRVTEYAFCEMTKLN